MSPRSRRRRTRDARHLCAACRERRAKFQYKGQVRADRDHVLCFQCFRAERERHRARQLVLFPRTQPAASLTTDAIAHRRRMLTHLEAQAAYAAERRH